MAEDRKKAKSLGGEFMVQDMDHMSDGGQAGVQADPAGRWQAEQSQSDSRQQGGDHGGSHQHGGEKGRKKR